MMIRCAALLMAGLFVTAAGDPSPGCGSGPTDWCSSPPGDACGAHRNEAECRADPRCAGMPYKGESVVACMPDGKGFASNCPSVGCVSRPVPAPR